jgi:tRNA pseudouridine55 synthase
VRVDQLELVELALPDVRFRATVSAGTYLRSIARDLGESLGCGAHLAALRRTAVGPFDLTEAVTPNEVTVDRLRDPGVLVSELPRHMLTPEEREAAAHGRPIHVERATLERGTDQPVALFAGEELIAVAEVADDMLKPRVVVAEP